MDRQAAYYRAPVWMQNALVSAYGMYLRHKRYRGDYPRIETQLRAMRHADPGTVTAYQRERLRAIVEHGAASVPFYRRLFAELGVRPADIRTVDDLSRLPVLEKEVVRNEQTGLVADGARTFWKQYTSGSTGTPLGVCLNRYTYQLFAALLVEHEALFGVTPDDLRATFAGRMVQPLEDDSPPYWRWNRADNQVLFSAYHLKDATIPLYLAELERIQPKEIIGYPSAIYAVAEYCLRFGLTPRIRPRVVVTNSETVWAWQRAAIEKVFGCPVADYYGSAECVAFGGQCAAGTYHFHPLLSIVEIVDADGRQVRPGESGALVATTLTNDVMPLVRYRIGDVAVRASDGCACGSPWPGASAIVGREDDDIITSDGRAVGRIDHIFKGMTGIRECQVIQETHTAVRLDVIADAGFNDVQRALLVRHLRERIGRDFEIQIREVSDIPRTARGKFRGVVSHVARARQSERMRCAAGSVT